MRRFFRSKKFIITAVAAVVLTVLTVVFGCLGGWANPASAFLGYVVTPVQNAFKGVSDGVSGFFDTFTKYDELQKENAELREQISKLTEEKLEWEEAVNQNEVYKDYLGIKEEHSDFEFCPAKVISRDPSDPFGTLTVSAGSLNGVSPRDPVITPDGVVGYVGTVGPTYSTVITVLDPSVKISAYDNRTGDSGIAHGDVAAAGGDKFVLGSLSRYSTVAKGDYIVTSGGGVFPGGLMLGTVSSVAQQSASLSLQAEIAPAADIRNCSNIMIITSFSGQSSFDSLLEQE